jgi:hypothetical protein
MKSIEKFCKKIKKGGMWEGRIRKSNKGGEYDQNILHAYVKMSQ